MCFCKICKKPVEHTENDGCNVYHWDCLFDSLKETREAVLEKRRKLLQASKPAEPAG
jgi:hypothetical protein